MRYRDLWVQRVSSWQRQVDHVRFICARLRPEDVVEAFALVPIEHPDVLVQRYKECLPIAAHFVLIGKHGCPRPIALLGVWEIYPHVGGAQMLATTEFDQIATDVSRYVKDVMIPRLITLGYRRVEVRALKSATRNRRWIEWLGATRECDVPLLGKDGETFVQYAWTHKGDDTCASDHRGRQ